MNIRAAFILAGLLTACGDPSGPAASSRPIYFMYSGANYTISSVLADGSAPPQPVTIPGLFPSVSPDGTRLAWLPDFGQCCGVQVRQLPGGTTSTVTPTGSVQSASWSPDGTHMLLSLEPDGEITRVNLATGATDTLTKDIATPMFNAVWSPDGQTLLATSGDVALDAEIWRFSPNGDTATMFVHHANSTRDPAWSPDGARVAYAVGFNDRFSIWVADADGGNPTMLTNEPGTAADLMPAWSPDSRHIAFHRNYSRCNPTCQLRSDVFVMAADGSGLRNLTGSTQHGGMAVSW